MDKLTLAHEYALEMAKQGIPLKSCLELGWKYADAMQAEADKRNKVEAEQKRKEMREMLNAPNTFVEREGRHFDDVNWQPDWSQAPDEAKYWAMDKDGSANFFRRNPEITNGNGWDFGGVMQANNTHGYTGDWKNSLRKRQQ